ncbi:MAG: tyrosine-protein phosphatase [Pseudomonadales bacterium]|nr:tyrosine-protein phosphatase [Pseudomonadales bacterium]
MTRSFRSLSLLFSLFLIVLSPLVLADEALLSSYDKLLPLEGGSNFRDMGGYAGANGKSVVRGKLFRSGAPSSLTQKDMDYLDQFDFAAIVDLRSSEELDLYPNRWAQQSHIRYLNVDYSIFQLMGDPREVSAEQMQAQMDPEAMYRNFPTMLKPQLTLYLDSLLQSEGPVLVNCSAGQDRTGVATAVILSLLGVERDTILQDYQLSTQFRRPAVERGNVDLAEAAKTNAFAALMLNYAGAEEETAQPLVLADGTPYLFFALDEIDHHWGSVQNYAETELGLSEAELAQLRAKYLD